VVYVADLATRAEITGAGGTTNLARKVLDGIPSPTPNAPRFIPGELVDMEFVPRANVAYAVARAADLVQRVVWDDAAVTIGSSQNKQIDLAGNDAIGRCQAPTGIAVNAKASRAYVNCWVTRRLGVIDLAAQALVATVEAAPAAQSAEEQSVARGRRFYFTGRGRWSNAGSNGAKGVRGGGRAARATPPSRARGPARRPAPRSTTKSRCRSSSSTPPTATRRRTSPGWGGRSRSSPMTRRWRPAATRTGTTSTTS
jgi:hypothetical protein